MINPSSTFLHLIFHRQKVKTGKVRLKIDAYNFAWQVKDSCMGALI